MLKMSFRTKCIILLWSAGAIFFIGRSTAPANVKTEIKTVTVRDENAIAHAVENERKKILTNFEANKVRDIVRLPDGTVKVREIITNRRISVETGNSEKKISLKTNNHETKETLLKTKGNDFSVELLIGKEKSVLLNSLPQNNLIFGVNLSRNIFNGTWVGIWGTFERESIFGLSLRQDF